MMMILMTVDAAVAGVVLLLGGVVATHVCALLWLVLAKAATRHEDGGRTIGAVRPPISMIKPIKGNSPTLRGNLESCFRALSPQDDEILMCVETEEDPALAIARHVAASYPNITCRFFTHASSVGVNPKINNIYDAFHAAAHDFVWIHDANVFINDPSTPAVMARTLASSPSVGIVHQLPIIAPAVDLANTIEEVYFATQHAHMYVFANVTGANCVNGMSNMFRRSTFKAICGDLTSVSHHIAEDFFISKALHDAGLRHVLAPPPAVQRQQPRAIANIAARHLRWGRLRRGNTPLLALLEPLTEPLILIVIACTLLTVCCPGGGGGESTRLPSSVVVGGLDVVSWRTAIALLAGVWLAVDAATIALLRSMCTRVNGSLSQQQQQQQRSLCTIPLAWLIRQGSAVLLYIGALSSRDVHWRGRQYHVTSTGSRPIT
ncbi:hypothetical protein PTSG_10666 [Salpingoeca rosetta]|uniref:ceramide glucosyltransferase n=1 Tax=Salpingoeca rosetta (strain ATCC 50818 / BSB-021) TaxID=946362 RepID=F2UQ14_SALR5|nr:uncharacterized protein PTSG_10666 [Salpingoeca rosetta]EGD79682.1 hypothetical protein PTSG_10666 [Salpingoeca rosetta]|eukprot:XP_004988632.1 hypothetical protein PTSG_10666 [Salpingoeca rosetta]